MKITFSIVLFAFGMAIAHSALAATDTTTFNMTATVQAACDVTANDLSFGSYDPALVGALDGSFTVSVSCTNGTAYTVGLNVGTGGGTFVGRRLASGGNILNFNLYTTAGRTTVWGDGSGATQTVAGNGAGLLTPVTHTVHGRIGAGQDVPTGSYASVITVTVTF